MVKTAQPHASEHTHQITEKTQRAEPPLSARGLSPFEEMERLFGRMNRAFGDLFPRGWMRPLPREWLPRSEWIASLERWVPPIDVIDRDDEILVRAEVPGVDKQALEVSVTDHTLTLKGKAGQEEEPGEYYLCEMSRGSFTRKVALPDNVEASEVKATLNNGILELVLPKVEKTKRHTVTIE